MGGTCRRLGTRRVVAQHVRDARIVDGAADRTPIALVQEINTAAGASAISRIVSVRMRRGHGRENAGRWFRAGVVVAERPLIRERPNQTGCRPVDGNVGGVVARVARFTSVFITFGPIRPSG